MIDHEKSKVVCNKELYDLNCQPFEVSLLRPAPSSGLKFIIFIYLNFVYAFPSWFQKIFPFFTMFTGMYISYVLD